MDIINIYRGSVLLEAIIPDDSSVQVKSVMGDNVLNFNFVLNHYTDFFLNDHCTVYGELYKINTVPVFRKISSVRYEYTLVMHAEYYDLTKSQCLFLNNINALRESDFSLMGTAEDFIKLILENANRVTPQWKKGDVIYTGYKNLTFSKENCLDALSRVAEAFGSEYWIEGKTIHLARRRRISNMKFRHGRNRGLYSIVRQPLTDGRIITRLYTYGSEKNLPPDYRNFTKRLKMEGGTDYIEQNTGYGIIEETQIFEDIYPRRTGKVTAIGADIFTIYDSTLDFDINQYLLPGVVAKITFNTGRLAGYTFKIERYNPSSKEIRFLKSEEEKVLNIPNDAIRAIIGDEYVLIDIQMPPVYVTKAEHELSAAAQRLLQTISKPQNSYSVEIDPLYMKRRNYRLSIGDEVIVEDAQFGINEIIAVIRTTRNIKNEWLYEIEIASRASQGQYTQLRSGQASNSRDIQTIDRTISNSNPNQVIGDLTIVSGSIVAQELPKTSTDVGYSPLYINNTTGKVFRKV